MDNTCLGLCFCDHGLDLREMGHHIYVRTSLLVRCCTYISVLCMCGTASYSTKSIVNARQPIDDEAVSGGD